MKATNAEAAGASAIVLYNNAAGALAPTVAGTPAITVPVVAITAAQGATLSGLITGGTTNLDWTSDYVSFPYGTGGLISGFSSYGLNAELRFKPNLGAPGGGIVSSYPLELGGIAALSGTSMSSPHVAGAVALILQAKGKVSPAVMARQLQNSADPKTWSGNAALGLLGFRPPPGRRHAGHPRRARLEDHPFARAPERRREPGRREDLRDCRQQQVECRGYL